MRITFANFFALPNSDAPQAKCEIERALGPSDRRTLSSESDETSAQTTPLPATRLSMSSTPANSLISSSPADFIRRMSRAISGMRHIGT